LTTKMLASTVQFSRCGRSRPWIIACVHRPQSRDTVR
jgi:hypothetical protein